MKALSIKQPWSWMIIHSGKDIENRTWPTKFRGEFLIHAGKEIDPEGMDLLRRISEKAGRDMPKLKTGGIVGIAEITDCVTESTSPWFDGHYGFVLKNAREVEFVELKGKLGFFDVDVEIED